MKLFATISVLLLSFSVQAKPWLALDLASWNSLQEMCENYQDFGAQVPPTDIQVKCQTTKTFTQVVGSKDLIFPSTGSLMMSISSSKANVLPTSTALASTSVTVQCPVVAKFKQRASGTFPTSCDELQSYKGTFAEFCLEKLAGGQFDGAAEQVPGTERSLCAKTECREEPLN